MVRSRISAMAAGSGGFAPRCAAVTWRSDAAFTAAGTVFRSLPEPIRSQVTKLSATTASDVSFVLGETGTTVVWGTADESARKAIVLETAMEALPPDDVDTYDVSSPGAIVVR